MNSKVYRQSTLSSVQKTLLQHVERGSSVLEMGCATGHMTRYLSEELGCRVTAVELVPEQAQEALPYSDRMIVGDIAHDTTWNEIGSGYDCVLYADVLEHLADPWLALRRTQGILRKGGVVLTSIPNIAHISVRLKLLVGKFDYTSYGILDDSHLRFFTAQSARELFESTGYEVAAFSGIYRNRHKVVLASLFPNVLALEYVVKATSNA